MDTITQQPTHTTKPTKVLFVLLAFAIFILAFAVGYYVGLTHQKNITTTKPTPEASSTILPPPWPETISEEKNRKIGEKPPELGIQFAGMEKTTYDKTTYSYQNASYTLLNLALPDKDIQGIGHTLKNDENGSYLEFVYEGFVIKDLDILSRQLAQSPGYYPDTIYSSSYQIFTNKNGIKMKKQYGLLPGYIEKRVEFIISSGKVSYPYSLYKFSTYYSSNSKYSFDLPNTNSFAIIDGYQIPQFTALDKFIETITY